MKKIGLITVASTLVALFAATAANAGQISFSLYSGTPTASGTSFSFDSIIGSSSVAGFTAGETGLAKLSGGVFTLDGTTLISSGSAFDFPGYVFDAGTGGTVSATYQPASGKIAAISGTYLAPTPEASSVAALGAMLLVGGGLVLAGKRKASSTIA